ncbi:MULTISPECIES: YggT family protein [Pseudidiomarina]|uniref:YggT family protein n=2 Tax=Pseudidiomarina TaxID=2800384 RepID=A0A368USE3_9GAMM|nr:MULTISPECIES: YggT family protein [Pseudidiomarina]PWW10606.1 YggT family protein [Pseudidiomarina maritima]RBP88354.1 YggT family protein [Pseudidiomarina tainanensis]RCW30284.1 YggT family protein [Pseudidiomarina tainanensis]
MNAVTFLVDFVFDLFLMVVILRVWMQAVRADFYNPLSQFVVKVSNPLVLPLRSVLPTLGRWDLAAVVLALLVAVAKIYLVQILINAPLPMVVTALISSLFLVVFQFLSILFWVTLIRALMSWFSQGYHPMTAMLAQLTEPFLAPIRRIIPPIGGLDLSVLVLIVGIQFVRILLGNMLI